MYLFISVDTRFKNTTILDHIKQKINFNTVKITLQNEPPI